MIATRPDLNAWFRGLELVPRLLEKQGEYDDDTIDETPADI